MKGFHDKELGALLVLMRSGLWEKAPEDLSFFPLSTESWQAVYQMAVNQTITGIVYRGVCHLPDRFFPPAKILLRWVAAVDAIERQNRKMNAVLTELYRQFVDRGMAVVLQKGQGISLMYEQPLLRECGDIDFYFLERKDADQTFRLLQDRHVPVIPAADESFHYNWKGIKVEHHVRLFDAHSRFTVNYLKKKEKEKGFVRVKLSESSDVDVFVPSPLLNLVMLNMHILKHALGYGIGLRQLCDMARASWCLRHEVSAEELRAVYSKAGIRKWSRLLDDFLLRYMGLPPEAKVYDGRPQSTRPLLDIILKGGNFGFQVQTRFQSLDEAVWKRKILTFSAYMRNLDFALRYAPQEMLWTLFSLTKGQFR